jgi:hypothetical protein
MALGTTLKANYCPVNVKDVISTLWDWQKCPTYINIAAPHNNPQIMILTGTSQIADMKG